MHAIKSLALSSILVLILAALAAFLPGCGGGSSLTPEESAQHDADMASLAALGQHQASIQPVNCTAGACR